MTPRCQSNGGFESGLFDPGFPVALRAGSLSFVYGAGVFGPEPELRRLEQIRSSLLDQRCNGPDPVYGICMDIGRVEDREELQRRWLLFGAVAYAAGLLGREPVRSQGHAHAVAPHSGWSPPELFEVWQGRAIVYMQERDRSDPGRCYAVTANPGEHVIVPPGWPHFVASADPEQPMVFGALCDRQYGFVYDGVRARQGLAWFPVYEDGEMRWLPNVNYSPSTLHIGRPGSCAAFGVQEGVRIYRQFEEDADALQWVSDPARMEALWPESSPMDEPGQVVIA